MDSSPRRNMINRLPFCADRSPEQRIKAVMRMAQLRYRVVMPVPIFIRPNRPLQRRRAVRQMLAARRPHPLRHVSRLVGGDVIQVERALAVPVPVVRPRRRVLVRVGQHALRLVRVEAVARALARQPGLGELVPRAPLGFGFGDRRAAFEDADLGRLPGGGGLARVVTTSWRRVAQK